MRVARRAGGGLRRLTPTGVVALLCAGAFGPVLAVPGLLGVGGAAAVASVAVLGSVGANVLTDVLMKAVDTMRARGGQLTQEHIEDELARIVEDALRADNAMAQELRADIAAVLQEIDGVGAALAAAMEAGEGGDRDIQFQLTTAFTGLGKDFVEFGFVLVEVRATTRAIQEALRQQSSQARLMLEKLAAIERQTRPGVDAGGLARDVAWSGGSPYRGLWTFDQDHEGVFCGRESITTDLVGRAAQRLSGLGLVAVTGASGAGKSSLLRAGFIPEVARGALADGSQTWPRLVMTPTRAPIDELAAHLAMVSGADVSAMRAALLERPGDAHLLARQAVLAATSGHTAPNPEAGAPAPRFVLVVDQFEEVFTLTQHLPAAEVDAFLIALRAVAGTRVGPADEPAALVVLGIRGDFWDRCAATPQLADVLEDSRFVVGPMSQEELRSAITGPAAATGLDIEPGLTDTILADLRPLTGPVGFEIGALPLLSQAMLVTWEHRDGNRLTARGYAKSGGVRGAVASSAEKVYRDLAARGQVAARTVFHVMTIVSGDGQFARRRVTRRHLHLALPDMRGAEVDAVLDAFADQRLIILNDDTVEIAHDALLRAWPRLQEWLDSDRNDRLLHSRLVTDTTRWLDSDRDPSHLYRGAELTTVRQAVARWDADSDRYPGLPLNPDTSGFLTASTRAARRSTRTKQMAVAALVVLLVATGIFATVAAINAAAARRKHDLALSRQLAAQSDALVDVDPVLAQRIAVAAWRVSSTPETRYSMINALAGRGRSTLTGHTDEVSQVVFSSDGKALATISLDHTVRLWDATTGRQTGEPLAGRSDDLSAVTFSPDGKILAVAGVGTLRLWDVATRRQIGDTVTADVGTATFSPDGRVLATIGTADGVVRLWDVATLRQMGDPFDDADDNKYAMAFGPDGKTLAVVSGNLGDQPADQTVRLWNVASHDEIGPPLTNTSSGAALSVAFSPDGRTLATGADNKIVLWDIATHRQTGDSLTGGSQLMFSPDGTMLATDGDDHTVRLWDMATHQQIGDTLAGHTGRITSIAFSRDGKALATSSADRSARIWDVATHRQTGAPLTAGFTRTVAFIPNTTILASGSENPPVQWWDTTTREPIGQLPAPGRSIAVSQKGDILASGGEERPVLLWDVSKARTIASLNTKGWSVALSPDGTTLATADGDKTVRIWDVATRQQVDELTTKATSVAYSPDETTFATAGDNAVQLWNATTRKRIGELTAGKDANIYQVAFDPSGKTLATAGGDGTVRLWDVATRRQVGDIPTNGSSMSFSPDGRTLATDSGDDGNVQLWDVATRRAIGAPLTGHTAVVYATAFSPDGQTLASVSLDGTVRFWNVQPYQEPADAICNHAGPLTQEQWDHYAPGEPMPSFCP